MTEELIVTPHQDLLDRVALVTGAASGIGLAITKRLLLEGAKVALWDFNEDRLSQAKKYVRILSLKIGFSSFAAILPRKRMLLMQ